jgi:hypothetical protein
MEKVHPFKWTISIIAQIDNYNEWEYNNLLKTIEWQDMIDNLRYVILEYRQGDQPTATVRQLNKNKPTLKNEDGIKLDVRSSLADPALLENFFQNHVLPDKGISEHHMLITWGHGAGLGYFYYKDNDTKAKNDILHNFNVRTKHSVERQNNVGRKDFKKLQRGFNRRNVDYNHFAANIMDDRINQQKNLRALGRELNLLDEPNLGDYAWEQINDDDYEMILKRTQLLTPSQLANVLKTSFVEIDEDNEISKAIPINVFIANNCFSNMFEAGYVLRDNVEVYAASQSIVPFAGVNYGKLFESLDDYPDQDMEELALNITDSFLPRYTEGGFAKAFKIQRPDLNVRDFSISVNVLKYYENFYAIIDDLAKHLLEQLRDKDTRENYLEKIDIAREFCGDLAQGVGFIDFTNFFVELIKSFQDKNPGILKKIYKEFFFLKEQTLLSIINPGNLFKFMPDNFYSQSPQMFSIFFPSKFKRSHVIDQLVALYAQFMQSSENWSGWHWPIFLSEYLGVDITNAQENQ